MTKVLIGTLNDLFKDKEPPDGGESKRIADALAGQDKQVNPPFRIPAADTGTEIFFDNLELLSRFANMPLPTQEMFCKQVRKSLNEAGIEILRLVIKWSEKENKAIKIRFVNGHHLDIFLED